MTTSSRREFLQALLGLPALSLGLDACAPWRRTGGGPRFQGEVLGGPDAVGHRLRDGFRPAATGRSRVGVLIVGGGAAGLSAAWRLSRAGFHDYRVLELDDAPGGTARSGENAVSRYPWGAHYLPCPLPHARAVM